MGNTTDFIGSSVQRSVAALMLFLLIGGCGAMRPAPLYRDEVAGLEGRLPRVSRDDLLNELSLYHGAPYLEGGNSISGIDCSGLVRSVFGSLGVDLPRRASDQFGEGLPVSRKDLRTGDLLFFGRAGSPSHVGIAVSNREMMHASSSRGVVLEGIDEFSRYQPLAGIKRIVRLY